MLTNSVNKKLGRIFGTFLFVTGVIVAVQRLPKKQQIATTVNWYQDGTNMVLMDGYHDNIILKISWIQDSVNLRLFELYAQELTNQIFQNFRPHVVKINNDYWNLDLICALRANIHFLPVTPNQCKYGFSSATQTKIVQKASLNSINCTQSLFRDS